MIDFNDFSSEVFQILRAYGKDIVLYDDTGKRVFEPSEARRMYVIGDNILVSIVEDGDNSAVKLFLSPSLNLSQVQGFLETLRRLAVQSNLLFHVKKYNKEIKPKDFATQAAVNEHKEIPMNIMEGLYGTSKSSYLKMENARMIVRHSARVKEHVIGDRGRHIHSIFVENAQGERFLFPVNMLSGARAMTQHVSNGGNFADEVGSQIVRMAQDFRNLAQVTNHIKTSNGLGESADILRVAIMESMKATKRSFARICTEATYVGECAKVASNTNLTEGSESLSESVAALAEILGEGVSESALLSVARSVTIESATAPQLDEELDDETVEENEEVEGDDEMEEGHAIDVAVEGAYTDTPNNPQIREFEEWMEGFDPDNMFASKKDPEAMSAEEVQAEIDEIESKYADPSQMPPEVAARWDALAAINVTNIKWGTDRIKQKTTEAPAQWEVHGTIGLNNKFCKKFDSESARQEWLDKYEDSGKFEVTELVDPEQMMAEGSSFDFDREVYAPDATVYMDYDEWDAARASVDAVEESEDYSKDAQGYYVARWYGELTDGKGWVDFSGPAEVTEVTESTISFVAVQCDGQFYKCDDEATAKKVLRALQASGADDAAIVSNVQLPGSFAAEIDRNAQLITTKLLAQMYNRNVGAADAHLGMQLADAYAYDLTGMDESVNEGKSYKKNDDEDAKSKKEKDQERKGAAKQKKEPVAEAGNFRAGSKAGFKAGQSAIKNMKAAAKEKEEKEKAEKKVAEGKSFKRSDDDETDVKAKRKDDKEKRDAKKPVEEGKSFKRNDDDEVDADTKKKEDKQKRDEKKKPVSEDATRFSGSFETNINAEGGSVVSAKVTYVPNGAGAATILSVVRGDTGEDVLPFMDDDDIAHVEGLCADDIAQQGSEQFAMSESDNDSMIRDDGWFSINAEYMLDDADRAEYDQKLGSLGYQVDVDYEWSIAGGDDCPDGIIIHSDRMKSDSKVLTILAVIHGPGAYGESTTIPRNSHQDFKDDVMTGGKGGEEQDPAYIARMKALAGLK
jgi:hypothetical protein